VKRHQALLLVLLIGVVLVFTSCHKTQEDKVLYLYNWTYYTPMKSFNPSKRKQHHRHRGQLRVQRRDVAKVQAGGGAKGYDLIVPSQDYVSIMIKLGMLHELDHSKIPNLKYIRPEINKMAQYDPQMQYSVPYFAGGSGSPSTRQR
jgi:spermidine/putrescine transport system substrate-binding protein